MDINRRDFLKGAAGVAATAGVAGIGGSSLLHGLAGESVAASEIKNPALATFPTAMCHAPMRMMYEKGFYKKYGPKNLTLRTISDRDPVNEGLVGGKLHYAYGGGLECIILIDRGMPFVVTGGVHAGCIRAVSQPGIEDWRQLKGKKIGVNILGSFPYFITCNMLTEAGLDYKKDAQILIVSPPDMIPAFRQKKVDAICMWDPIPMLIPELGIPHHMLWDMNTAPKWKDEVCCFSLQPRSVAEKHPGLAWQFNECITAASHWLEESDDNIRECVDIQIKKKYTPGKAKAQFQFDLIKSYDFSIAGNQEICERSLNFYYDIGKKFGALKHTKEELMKIMWKDYTKLPKGPA